jgi:hypothetical protein
MWHGLSLFWRIMVSVGGGIATVAAGWKSLRAFWKWCQFKRGRKVDDKIIHALANQVSWGSGPFTGAGDRLVRVGQIAEILSLQEGVVADSLERLEKQNKVKQHSGTLDNPAPYWSIVRR